MHFVFNLILAGNLFLVDRNRLKVILRTNFEDYLLFNINLAIVKFEKDNFPCLINNGEFKKKISLLIACISSGWPTLVYIKSQSMKSS